MSAGSALFVEFTSRRCQACQDDQDVTTNTSLLVHVTEMLHPGSSSTPFLLSIYPVFRGPWGRHPASYVAMLPFARNNQPRSLAPNTRRAGRWDARGYAGTRVPGSWNGFGGNHKTHGRHGVPFPPLLSSGVDGASLISHAQCKLDLTPSSASPTSVATEGGHTSTRQGRGQ